MHQDIFINMSFYAENVSKLNFNFSFAGYLLKSFNLKKKYLKLLVSVIKQDLNSPVISAFMLQTENALTIVFCSFLWSYIL